MTAGTPPEDEEPGAGARSSSFGFQWHLSDRCNLRCAHCYQDRFDRRSERPLEDLRRMADRIALGLSGRGLTVSLTGGEPLLLPWLPELVDHLSGQDGLEELHVITNGTRTDPAALEPLGAARALTTFKVSVESADERVNDAIRGAGNLARVRGGLPALLETGKAVVLMTTLGRHNLESVEPLARLARAEGLHGVIYERFVPLGRGRAMASQALDPAGFRAALEALARLSGLEVEPEALLAYRAFWLSTDPAEPEPLRGALCNLGDDSMALMPDGTVFPCRRLPVAQGNVLEEPFETLLGRLRAFRPEALRAKLRGELCGRCGVEGCVGCRALARAAEADPLGDDPGCPLRCEP